jgi:hypothetical protein
VNPVILLHEGHCTIKIYRDWIFGKEALPKGYALTASALSYAYLLRHELSRRHPHTTFVVSVHAGDVPMLISISDNHPKEKQLFDDISRLAVDIATHYREKFLVKVGSAEEKALTAIHEPKPPTKIRRMKKRDPRIQTKQ